MNADRAARHEEDLKKQRRKVQIEAEYASKLITSKSTSRATRDQTPDLASIDERGLGPAKSTTEDAIPNEEVANKYLAAKPYKAKRGDRFS